MSLNSARAAKLEGNGFKGDDHPSLSNMIHGSLRASILNGSLAPGQVLRQEELAAQFRTSRVPLREALQLLQAEGLVVLRPRRGYAVHALDGAQLVELLRLRLLIEGFGGYIGTLRRTERDIAQLAGILQDMEKMPAKLARETQRVRWWTLDRQFHRAIFTAGRTAQIGEMFDNITAKTDPYVMHDEAMIAFQQTALDDHRQIFAAFSKGDADRAAVLSRTHCERLAMHFAEALRQDGQVAGEPKPQITDLGPALATTARPAGNGVTSPRRKPRAIG
jgi:DNA-binding GntR family transcriptional regulator